MSTRIRDNFNLNTILISVVLTLSGWTLKKVSEQGEQMAGLSAKVQNLERIVYKTE